ncbi:hypothetical protein BC828DRAFT_418432 [Blastocladiella britannica]|nr:hypothetical protein BC828DRAFT_418432 [Blastocladiella britannica]
MLLGVGASLSLGSTPSPALALSVLFVALLGAMMGIGRQSEMQAKMAPSQLTPIKQQLQQRPNGQVYRPTPVKEHPDDAFLTGAWIF